MAKTYSTEIGIKFGDAVSFNTPDVYQQAHAHQDIHTYVDRDGTQTEIFIPWSMVSHVTFDVEDSEAEPAEDKFCKEGV